jgi:RNA polymerase sigma-70 factor (ECF subfamily)
MDQDKTTQDVDALFDSWYPQLLRYTIRLVLLRTSAEELVQDTFLDYYKALLAGQTIQFPKAWTMSVVRRKVFERRREPFGVDRNHDDLEAVELTGEWSGAVDLAIDCERMRSHMELLTPREQEVLMLRLESMKYREIGIALGISANTVNTLLSRALDKLQVSFAAFKPESSVRRML